MMEKKMSVNEKVVGGRIATISLFGKDLRGGGQPHHVSLSVAQAHWLPVREAGGQLFPAS